jgi:hypothetical protein
MSRSRRIVPVLALVCALALAVPPLARAQVEVGDAITQEATVTAIDLATRTVELKGADGKTDSMVVPANIQNLDKLKVGDTVIATYAIALAAELLKPGEKPGPASISAAKQGGGEILSAQQVSAVVKIEKIDLATNSVTFSRAGGKTTTLRVKRPEIQAKLKDLKPGDQVEVTYTEAMAIKVEPKAK